MFSNSHTSTVTRTHRPAGTGVPQPSPVRPLGHLVPVVPALLGTAGRFALPMALTAAAPPTPPGLVAALVISHLKPTQHFVLHTARLDGASPRSAAQSPHVQRTHLPPPSSPLPNGRSPSSPQPSPAPRRAPFPHRGGRSHFLCRGTDTQHGGPGRPRGSRPGPRRRAGGGPSPAAGQRDSLPYLSSPGCRRALRLLSLRSLKLSLRSPEPSLPPQLNHSQLSAATKWRSLMARAVRHTTGQGGGGAIKWAELPRCPARPPPPRCANPLCKDKSKRRVQPTGREFSLSGTLLSSRGKN